uniref:Uncharacterized protein n=1 Tax=Rhizophora mucronata TaxID=61149 RepID=A0A2P2NQT0_RHIMU
MLFYIKKIIAFWVKFMENSIVWCSSLILNLVLIYFRNTYAF